jgi:hypothetical protein
MVGVGGTGVFVGGIGVFVGGTGVFVSGIGVFVGETTAEARTHPNDKAAIKANTKNKN